MQRADRAEAVIDGLESGRIGGLGMDLFEEDDGSFLDVAMAPSLPTPLLARLLRHHNVVVTARQGHYTVETLALIAASTLTNASEFGRHGHCLNAVHIAA